MSDSIKIASFIARASDVSRRAAEKLVRDGKVTVNGKQMRNVAERVDPDKDRVAVNGIVISILSDHVYVMLHKPRGIITTMNDPAGRPSIIKLIPRYKRRVFPVGRLDTDTEGLLLLTSDGDWAQRVAHPSSEVNKTYLLEIRGNLSHKDQRALREGMILDEEKTAPAAIHFIGHSHGGSVWQLIIHEGKRRQIRRMFAQLGHAVRQLKRTAIGKLELGNLACGTSRTLSKVERELVFE